jgi:hypothetical protein
LGLSDLDFQGETKMELPQYFVTLFFSVSSAESMVSVNILLLGIYLHLAAGIVQSV